jgi:hypothetical protein
VDLFGPPVAMHDRSAARSLLARTRACEPAQMFWADGQRHT